MQKEGRPAGAREARQAGLQSGQELQPLQLVFSLLVLGTPRPLTPNNFAILPAHAQTRVVSFEFHDFPSCYEVGVLSRGPEKVGGLPEFQRWPLWYLLWGSGDFRPLLEKNRPKWS